MEWCAEFSCVRVQPPRGQGAVLCFCTSGVATFWSLHVSDSIFVCRHKWNYIYFPF